MTSPDSLGRWQWFGYNFFQITKKKLIFYSLGKNVAGLGSINGARNGFKCPLVMNCECRAIGKPCTRLGVLPKPKRTNNNT